MLFNKSLFTWVKEVFVIFSQENNVICGWRERTPSPGSHFRVLIYPWLVWNRSPRSYRAHDYWPNPLSGVWTAKLISGQQGWPLLARLTLTLPIWSGNTSSQISLQSCTKRNLLTVLYFEIYFVIVHLIQSRCDFKSCFICVSLIDVF